MERRDLLRGGAIAVAAAIAGCAEGDDEDDESDEDDLEGTDDADDGADDGEDADEAADDADDGLDDDDDDGDDTDAADDGTDTDEDTDDEDADEDDGTDTDDEDADNEDADNEDADDGAEDDTDDAESEGVLFAETVEFEDSYIFETEGGTGEAVASRGRVHGENTYMTIEEGGGEIELYTVEGETYLIEGEECMVLPGMADEEFDEGDIEDPDAEAEAHPDLEDSGRTSIEGVEEEVYVFEIDGDEAAEHDEDVTYYVGVETGYLHRIESGPSVTDFHSWGEADPVEPPEMDCASLGDFDEDDLPL